MKRILNIFVLVPFIGLVSCNKNNNYKDDGDVYVEPDPVLVDDSYLLNHDDLNEDTYNNSIVLPSTGTGESNQAADPFILRYNGMYYLYATTSNRFVRGYKSKDLINWERVRGRGIDQGFVYDYSLDPNAPKDATPFAPEVFYYNGYFYMVCSPSGKGHYILRSNSPEGPFKSIAGNIGEGIDGSLFFESDGEILFFNAGAGSINALKMNDDLKSFTGYKISLNDNKVGGWNEGPFLLKYDGNYYMTYCGSHYLSPSYRVDYSFALGSSDPAKSGSYINKGHVLLKTDDPNFNGLGHSMTVLGPDLDSYYIVYHNLTPNNARYLDFTRLSFNGSRMVANNVSKNNNLVPSYPTFESESYGENLETVGDFYLSSESSEDTFTCEFNVTGFGKAIFAYHDENNYSYLTYSDNLDLGIYKVKDGKTTLVYEASLPENTNYDVNHAFRISYSKGETDLFFDTMEVANDIPSYFTGGKVGYDDYFDNVGYVAFSNVGQGSSDKKAYNSDYILANAYDDTLSYLRDGSDLVLVDEGDTLDSYSYNLILNNEGDRATYRIYSFNDSPLDLYIRMPTLYQGKKIGLRIDDGEIKEYTINSDTLIYKNGDVYFNLATLDLPYGPHYLSIYNVGDKVGFSEFQLVEKGDNDELNLTLNRNLDDRKLSIIGNITKESDFISTSNETSSGFVYDDIIYSGNYEASVTFSVDNLDDDGYVGLLFDAQHFKKNYSGDGSGENDPNGFTGYRLELDGSNANLYHIDYLNRELIDRTEFELNANTNYILRIVQNGKKISCYVNEELLFEDAYNISLDYGKVGLISSNINAKFYSLEAK